VPSGEVSTSSTIKVQQTGGSLLGWVTMTRSERRLSAILHADVAGFVRLVEREEDLTFEYLGAARSRIWQPTIENACGGRGHAAGACWFTRRAIPSLPSASRRLPPSRQPLPSRRAWHASTKTWPRSSDCCFASASMSVKSSTTKPPTISSATVLIWPNEFRCWPNPAGSPFPALSET